MKRLFREIAAFSGLLARASITAYAAQAAFFIFLSFFPFVMVLLMLARMLPGFDESLLNGMTDFLPSEVSGLLRTVFADIYRTSSSATVISLTAGAALWSAGKGVRSVIRGLNAVCGTPENRRWLRLRLQVLGDTAVMLVLVTVSLTVITLGGAAADRLFGASEWARLRGTGVRAVTLPLLLALLTGVFTLMYAFLPARRAKPGRLWLGALVAAVGWVVFSLVFAIYVERFSNLSVTYGSLTSVVVLMVWLYACMYILFLGAAINELPDRRDGESGKQKPPAK